jgi:hypothetical protein
MVVVPRTVPVSRASSKNRLKVENLTFAAAFDDAHWAADAGLLSPSTHRGDALVELADTLVQSSDVGTEAVSHVDPVGPGELELIGGALGERAGAAGPDCSRQHPAHD